MDQGVRKAVATSFVIVHIPIDTNSPLAEMTVAIPRKKDGTLDDIGCLIERLQRHFAELDTKAPLSPAEIARRKQAIRDQVKSNPQYKDQEISDDILSKVFMTTRVDSVPLLNNKKDHGYLAVNLYVDDQGVSKRLPVNARASDICCRLGNPLQVLGDAFIAQYFDDDDKFERKDFTLADLSLDAPWAVLAMKANQQKLMHPPQSPEILLRSAPSASTAGTLPIDPDSCGNCSKQAAMLCTRCRRIKYCSKECQVAHWSLHKRSTCVALPASTPLVSASPAAAASQIDEKIVVMGDEEDEPAPVKKSD